MRSDQARLRDIYEAIEQIEKYTAAGRARFDDDELIQTWVIHHLQVIGEAAPALSAEMKGSHPQIPWRQIIGMRHVLVHTYFGIDEDVVWAVVEDDLPPLKSQVEALLDE